MDKVKEEKIKNLINYFYLIGDCFKRYKEDNNNVSELDMVNFLQKAINKGQRTLIEIGACDITVNKEIELQKQIKELRTKIELFQSNSEIINSVSASVYIKNVKNRIQSILREKYGFSCFVKVNFNSDNIEFILQMIKVVDNKENIDIYKFENEEQLNKYLAETEIQNRIGLSNFETLETKHEGCKIIYNEKNNQKIKEMIMDVLEIDISKNNFDIEASSSLKEKYLLIDKIIVIGGLSL